MSSAPRFKVGDRVSIVRLGYFPEASQGLLVGNTGTIRTAYAAGLYGVETDNAEDSLSADGEGWAFSEHELEAAE